MGSRISLTIGRGVIFLVLVTLVFPLAAMGQAPEENKALVRQYLEAISGREKPAETVERYVSNEALKQHIAEFEAAFPRYEIIVEDMIAEGDMVVIRALGRGTHQGEFAGIAPTGKQVEFPAIIIYRIEDGKIAEFWMQADVMSLMQQLTEE